MRNSSSQETSPSKPGRRLRTGGIVAVAALAALVAGCSSTSSASAPAKPKPAHVYTLQPGEVVDMTYTVTEEQAAGSEAIVTNPFVMQAQKVGKRILFQLLAGKPGKTLPVLVEQDGSSYMTTDSPSVEKQLENEGFTPFRFSLPVTPGAGDTYEVSLPGQTDSEFVIIQTSRLGETTAVLEDANTMLTQRNPASTPSQ